MIICDFKFKRTENQYESACGILSLLDIMSFSSKFELSVSDLPFLKLFYVIQNATNIQSIFHEGQHLDSNRN